MIRAMLLVAFGVAWLEGAGVIHPPLPALALPILLVPHLWLVVRMSVRRSDYKGDSA